MASQDNAREKAQKKIFNLKEVPMENGKGTEDGRSNRYVPDAIIEGPLPDESYRIELKSAPTKALKKDRETGETKVVNKNIFTTARGFGQKKVDDWERETDAFVFSRYEGVDFDGKTWVSHHAGTFKDIFPFLEEKVLDPYYNGRKATHNSVGYFGVAEFENRLLPLLEGWEPEDVERLRHTIEVGASINDPKFNAKKLKKALTPIETEADLLPIARRGRKEKKEAS